jgi:hypothetical protein
MEDKLLRSKILAAPQPIKDWFGSEELANIVSGVNTHFHILGENQRIVPRLLLRLEIKDLSPDYFAGALATAFNIDKNRAMVIVSEIKSSALAPIEKDFAKYGVDLSLLDKFEIPIAQSATGTPKIIEEIRPAAATSSSSMPLPAKISTATSVTVPTPTSTPIPALKSQNSPARASLPNVVKPAESVPPPKPVMLQSESIPHPILNAPNFRMPTNAEDIMSTKNGPAPTPVRSAVVEFGNMPASRATSPQASPAGRTPLTQQAPISIKPLGTEPARTVTEITPEALKNFAPTPVTPPRPSFTPISQIPIPSPIAPKPQIASAPVPPSPVTFSPMPQPQKPPVTGIPMPQPANQPEKVVRKDYSEMEK